MLRRTPCRLYIHLDAFTYSVGPSSVRSVKKANLDHRLLRLFHQWECLKCNGHGPQSHVWMWPYVDIIGFNIEHLTHPHFFSPPWYHTSNHSILIWNSGLEYYYHFRIAFGCVINGDSMCFFTQIPMSVITLFTSNTMLCGTNNMMQNILHNNVNFIEHCHGYE